MAQTQDLTDAQIAQLQPGLGGEEPPAGLVNNQPPPTSPGAPSILSDPEIRQQIFRPTDRPDEPVTAGMPFGPGPNTPRTYREDDARRRDRVAREIESSPTATDAVRKFAQRIRAGT